jgi:hypothetical protein
LQVNGLRFWCRKLPNVDFYVQRAVIPSVNLPSVKNPNPLVNVSLGGDHIDFGDVTLEWIVDEDARSLIEVFNWICGIGFPESTEQYRNLFEQKPYSGLGLQSEGVLVVLDSKKRANFQYVFRDMSPHFARHDPFRHHGRRAQLRPGHRDVQHHGLRDRTSQVYCRIAVDISRIQDIICIHAGELPCN